MRISLLTYGTLGDVQPYIALGLALVGRRHDVVLAAPTNFDRTVRDAGLAVAPLAGDTRELLDSPESRRLLAAGDVKGLVASTRAALAPQLESLTRQALDACRGADLVVGTSVTSFLAHACAERAGARLALAELAPLTPDSVAVTSVIGFGETRALRRAWGLPDLSGNPDALARESGVTMVHAFSRHLVPRHPSWGATHHVTGAFSLPADVAHRLPGAHQDASFGRWLEQGDPPVYFGLGSLPVIDMGALVALTADVCHALGLRGVVSAGSSGRDVAETPVPPNLRVIGACHHDWLFPRCRVVLHHGGSGTVHAAARAGRPQVVCSVFSDQPFWGSLVSHLGLGAHLPFRHLAPATLRDALSVALSDEVAEKAAACGGRVRSESGAVAGAAALDGRGLDRAST